MNGRTIWITGLSGAGKSTIARALVSRLREADPTVVSLDGDELREVLGQAAVNGDDHGRAQRIELAMRYSRLCLLLSRQGFTVVIATISMFHEVQAWNRANLPGYVEIYLKVPLDELRRRDPKGLYRRHAAGEVRNVAGLDFAVDEPIAPDILVEFEADHIHDDAVDHVLRHLTRDRN
ncbi:MAG: adenylyl-sulfate kinase [Niveispirillum sp.]|nr:adenylyl-sulfate kinase [Niveispirillum sp.]